MKFSLATPTSPWPLALFELAPSPPALLVLAAAIIVAVVAAAVAVGLTLVVGALLAVARRIFASPTAVHLVDFETYKPPVHMRLSTEQVLDMFRNTPSVAAESVAFMRAIAARSGVGNATGVPECFLTTGAPRIPATVTLEHARTEAQTVMFAIVGELFARLNLRGKDVDIVVVNSSLFAPTPSLAAMLAHRFSMRADVQTFNLGGMGARAL